jgi:hypothetical protein
MAMRTIGTIRIFGTIFALLLLTAGCAGKRDTPSRDAVDTTAAPPSAEAFPKVSFELREPAALVEVVRRVGEETGGGLVMMNGLGEYLVQPFTAQRKDYRDFVRTLAQSTGMLYRQTPYYYFLYPEGYETLCDVTLAGAIHPRFETVAAQVAFGDSTALFNAFSVLGHSLGVTIVADNAVAESRCGELTLPEAPLSAILEAMLQSARVPPGAFQMESNDEYILIRSSQNQPPAKICLNQDELSPEEQAFLERRVNVMLPEASGKNAPAFYPSPTNLGRALGTLSRQLGIPVTAETKMHAIPVNPCSFTDVRIATALELIIRQWPVPEFGYEVRDGAIHLRRAPATAIR